MKNFSYFRPESTEAAVSLLDKAWGTCELLGGGTDLHDLQKEYVAQPTKVVSLGGIKEDGFRKVSRTGSAPRKFTLGAGVTLDVGFGQSQFDEDTGIEDYNDYSISVNRDFGPVNAAIGFYGTDADGEFNFGETADNRFVLTLSIGG